MQNYHGKGIISNSNEFDAMKRAVGVILWHFTEFRDNDYWHRYCTGDSWSPYK